jgi:hypothetical protein
MKRFKISLTLLAVVAAIGSAFTPRDTDFNWFKLLTPVVTATFDDAGVFNNLDTYTAANSIAPISIEEAADACPLTSPTNNKVCAVKITDYDEGTTTVLEDADLDASVDAFVYADIVSIKYKTP